MRSFGNTLRDLRIAQGFGLREVASLVEISPAYLSRIERDKERPPRPETIKSLAKVLAADPDVLFRLSSTTDPEINAFIQDKPEILTLVRLIKNVNLSEEDINSIIFDIEKNYLIS